MIGQGTGDQCYNCGKHQMPRWKSKFETARACQSCQYIEERDFTKEVEEKEVKQ